LSVDTELRFVVSPGLPEEFENGRAYYVLTDQLLSNLPDRLTDRPAREFPDWHNSEQNLGRRYQPARDPLRR